MEENIRELLDSAEELIVKGSLEKALDVLHLSLEDELDPENIIIQFLSRWNKTEKDAMVQLISREDMEVTQANITKGLLDFINEIRDKFDAEVNEVIELLTDLEPPILEGKKQVLVLYASEDVTWLETLNKHMFLLKRQTNLHFVDIHKDLPVSLKDVSIYQEKLIDVAEKVLCLVTPNCMSFAIYPLIEKAAADRKLIPLKIEKMDTKETIFEEIQGLPVNQKFVSEWDDHNSAFVDIASNLRQFFKA